MDRGPSRAAAVLCSLSLAAGLAGQWQFDPLFGGHLPTRFDQTMRVRLVDVDGDGDLDLVEGNGDKKLAAVARLQRNDGPGVFTDVTATHMPPRTLRPTWIDCGDLDGDGDVDLVFADGAMSDSVVVFLNQGGGQFVDGSATALLANIADVRITLLVDIDGDGDRDLVCGTIGASELVFVNDGSGHFADETASRLPPGLAAIGANAMVAGDLDGDGDLDLVTGGSRLRTLANQGNGVFVDTTLQWLASYPWHPVNPVTALALGDADGDGDRDLLVAHPNQNQLLRNNGAGTFTDVTAATMPYDNEAETGVVFTDCDGDGDPDIATAGASSDRYLRNVGGVFVDTLGQSMPLQVDASVDVAGGDVDGDGDLDLVFANRNFAQNRLVLNDGAGSFRDAVRSRVPLWDIPSGWSGIGYADALAHGDVDGDGDVDVIQADFGVALVLMRNDGSGLFQRQEIPIPQGAFVDAVAVHLVDLDADSDLDVLAWWSGLSWTVSVQLRNDGTGQFTDVSVSHMPAGLFVGTVGVCLADFDGDGDLDAISARSSSWWQSLDFWSNDGSARFTLVNPPHPWFQATAIHAADFDGDGDPDLVLGRYFQSCVLLANDGTGGFTDVTGTQSIAGSEETRALAMADVDGDGDLDLMVGEAGLGGSPIHRLYRNDGAFTFTDVTATQMPGLPAEPAAMMFADLDGDGDQDLVSGGDTLWLEVGDHILLNDGSGTFTDVGGQRAPTNPNKTGAVAIADFDGDGDLDIWYAKLWQDQLLCNLRHQLSAPLLLRPGRPWLLEAHARYAPPGVTDVVWSWLSTTRVSVPVPGFGVLGIDPMVPLSPLTIPQPAGVASLVLLVPNVPSLYGASLHAQGVCLSSSGFLHLTTVVSDLLLP